MAEKDSGLSAIAGVTSMVGGLAGLASAPAEYYMNKANAIQQQKWTQENARQLQEYQHELNRSATPEAVQGMRDAGLNPASLDKPMTPSSASAGAAGAKQDPVSVMQNIAFAEQMMSDANLKAAQTEQSAAEAQSVRIRNDRELHEDESWVVNYVAQMERLKDIFDDAGIVTDWIDESISGLRDNPDLNLGDLQGALAGMEATHKSFESFYQSIYDVLKMNDASKILGDLEHGTPEYQIAMQDLAYKLAVTTKVKDESANLKAELPAIKKQSQFIDAQIGKLVKDGKLSDAQANKIINSDPYTALEKGEYGKAAEIFIGEGSMKAAEGAGITLGLGVGNKVGAATKVGSKVVQAGKSALSRIAGKSGAKAVKSFANPFKKDSLNYNFYQRLVKQIGGENADRYVKQYLANGRGRTFESFVRKR